MAVTPFQDLPLADPERTWDRDAAEDRVRRLTGARDHPTEAYRRAHVWYDASAKENFTGYKLLVADVVDGKLKAVPRAVMAAAAVVQGSRGGIDLPPSEVTRVRNHLGRYYRKMGDTPPWDQ
jgi:hypothetical protein